MHAEYHCIRVTGPDFLCLFRDCYGNCDVLESHFVRFRNAGGLVQSCVNLVDDDPAVLLNPLDNVLVRHRPDETGHPAADTLYEDLVVLVYEVDGAVTYREGGDLTSVLDKLDFDALSDGGVRLLGLDTYLFQYDATGLSRTWPAPAWDYNNTFVQLANALYQVDESAYAGSQPVYHLIVKASEWSTWLNLMDNVSGGQYSDAEMNVTLVRVSGTGTETRYCSSLRNRGAGTRAAHPHNLHLTVPRDNLLQGPAVILGGLDSIPGAVIGGLVIGILENLSGGYLSRIFGGGVKEVAPFVFLVLILMVKPYGLFGTEEIERV